MKSRLRLRKLLETASHPSTSDGEKLNAIGAFRKISDKAGGLDEVFAAWANQEISDQLEATRATLQQMRIENDRLKMECETLLRQGAKRESPKTACPEPSHLNTEHFVVSVLSKDWQELHRIHEKAKAAGYNETSATTMNHLESLCLSGKATRREAGVHKNASGRNSWQPPSWRLKQKS